VVKRDLSSGIGRDENGEKLGQVLRVRGLIQDESVTQSAIIIAQRPFVESPKGKGIVGAGREISGAWDGAF
jgi:hypothetical protein